MKTLLCLLLVIPLISFSQEENTRGVIKIRKEPKDSCFASILGYKGTVVIKRNELLKAETIQLNTECNSEIVSFGLNLRYEDVSTRAEFLGRTDFSLKWFKDYEKIEVLSFRNIVVKNKVDGHLDTLPKIVFKVIN